VLLGAESARLSFSLPYFHCTLCPDWNWLKPLLTPLLCRCGTGVDNEHHLLFECSHVALVASRSKHRALFDGVKDVREWMAVAYKPELAATLGSCMQDMMHSLKAGPGRASQTSHRLLSWADVAINK
jgi:hypothetical protein